MNPKERDFGNRIALVLDMSANENIEKGTLIQLQINRLKALENFQSATKIINAGNATSALSGPEGHFSGSKFLILLTILLALMGTIYTQFGGDDIKSLSLNKLILTNDLPIDAYIDNEFDEWLDAE
jgi:lipoprotein signal peptidase